MSWQNILKAPSPTKLTPMMKRLSKTLFTVSDSELEEAVSNFVAKEIKKDGSTLKSIKKSLSILNTHLRTPPTAEYFDNEPFNLKNAYIERQKRNTFIDRGTKIRQILNTLDKDGGLSEDNSVLKLLIKNKDIEKLVKYLKGEISFNDYDIRDNKLSEIKRKVTERGVEKRLRLFKNELKDSDVRQTMMESLKGNSDILGYELEKGMMIAMPLEYDDLMKIINEQDVLKDLNLKVYPIIKTEEKREKRDDGKKLLESKDDVKFSYKTKDITDELSDKKSFFDKEAETTAYKNNPKFKGASAFMVEGFPKNLSYDQLVLFSGGIPLSKELKKTTIKKTFLGELLQLPDYISFKDNTILSRDRGSVARAKDTSDYIGVSEQIARDYFLKVSSSSQAIKPQEKRLFLKGTKPWFTQRVKQYKNNYYVFDMIFDNKKEQNIERALNKILTSRVKRQNVNDLLNKLKNITLLDETKIRRLVDIDNDLLTDLKRERARLIEEDGTVTARKWYQIANITPQDKKDESRLDFKERVIAFLPKLESVYSETATLSEKRRNGLLLYILKNELEDLDLDLEDLEDSNAESDTIDSLKSEIEKLKEEMRLLSNDDSNSNLRSMTGLKDFAPFQIFIENKESQRKNKPISTSGQSVSGKKDAVFQVYTRESSETEEQYNQRVGGLISEKIKELRSPYIGSLKSALKNMELINNTYQAKSNNRLIIEELKESIYPTEDNGADYVLETDEYNISDEFNDVIYFFASLDLTYNENREILSIIEKIDTNKNKKIDEQESEKDIIDSLVDKITERYSQLRKSLFTEIEASIKYVLDENIVRVKTKGRKKGTNLFEPLEWLANNGVRV